MRPRKEAYHHNRRPQSLFRTRDPTNNLPKGQAGFKGERREFEGWGRDQRGKREGKHKTGSRKKIER